MARLVSFGVLVCILVIISIIFYQVMATFIVPLFLATLLVVMFHPLHQAILARCRGKRYYAAALTTAAVLAIVLLPAAGIFTFAIIEASTVLTQFNIETVRNRLVQTRARLGLEIPHAATWRKIESTLTLSLIGPREAQDSGAPPLLPRDLPEVFDKLVARLRQSDVAFSQPQAEEVRDALQRIFEEEPGTINYDGAIQAALREFRQFKEQTLGGMLSTFVKDLLNPSDEQLRSAMLGGLSYAREWLFSAIGNTTTYILQIIVGLIVMIVSVYFFFVEGPKMVEYVMQLVPLDQSYQRELLTEFDRVSRAVVVATLLSAVVQGLLAGVGFYLAGLESVAMLILLTTVLAMVPFFGAASVWIPAALWLYFYDDRPVAAILLAIYGAAVVSTIDNIIKPWVLHGQSRLHPLVALLSVLGGVQALGPIGIVIGPMVVVFLGTLLKILQRELGRMDRLPWAPEGKK